MPELPEVETVCRGIKPYLEGASIIDSKVFNHKLRIPIPKDFSKLIKGCRVLKVQRKAKYILIHLSHEVLTSRPSGAPQDDEAGSLIIVIHLGMSGRLKFSGSEQEEIFYHQRKAHHKHDHALIQLSNGKFLIYNDPRKFGLVTVLDKDEFANFRFFKKLGIEPLSPELNPETLYKTLQRRNKSIKSVIMDSSLIVGVGNIYASESLFIAGIHPERIASTITKKEATKLHHAIVDTLERAIKAGGSTISDYAQADGSSGYFQHNFLVYGRIEKPCKKCRSKIQRIKQNGRSSYFCGKCQK